MSSALFDMVGIGWLDPAYIFILMLTISIILFVLVCVLFSKNAKLRKRMDRFMRGKDAMSLEKEISGIIDDNEFLKQAAEKNRKDIRKLFSRMETVYQKSYILKYDALHQMGGKLSFVLVMLNERNDGFLLNSVHSSNGCYVFTKEIVGGECAIELGDEEATALRQAMGD